jgi:hypothetical protein
MPDYMPRKDGAFLSWTVGFSSYVADHGAELGLSLQQVQAITAGVGTLETMINEHLTAQYAARSLRQQKTQARSDVEAMIRSVVRRFQASPEISNAQRESMGITVFGTGAAARRSHPPTVPTAIIDTQHRFRHLIRYRDGAYTARRARPDQTIGCEIWCAITAVDEKVPTTLEKFNNLGLSITSPYMHHLGSGDGGKMAHYMLRWVTTDGEKGAWGLKVSATIVG